MSMTGHKWMPRYPSQQHRIVVYTYKYCHKLAALPIKCHWKYVYPLNFIAWNKRLTINYHASYSSSCASKMCVCFVRRAQYVFFSVWGGQRKRTKWTYTFPYWYRVLIVFGVFMYFYNLAKSRGVYYYIFRGQSHKVRIKTFPPKYIDIHVIYVLRRSYNIRGLFVYWGLQ